MGSAVRMNSRVQLAAVAVLSLGAFIAQAQILKSTIQDRAAKTDAVRYMFPAEVTVPPGKPTAVALHFLIQQGLHINSHTPTEPDLIATAFSIPDGSGVRLDEATYPQGAAFAFPADPGTKLSIYSGEFIIQARIVATPGNHTVQAKLRYQACDNSACMPPKTINVSFDVTAK